MFLRKIRNNVTGILLGTMLMSCVPNQTLKSQHLEKHQWKHRVILIFASSDTTDKLAQQLQLFTEQQEALLDRELVIYKINDQVVDPNDEVLEREKAAEWRQRWGVPSEAFALVLIGKDGVKKLLEKDLTAPRKVFDLIDSMPMRQAEMRRKNNN